MSSTLEAKRRTGRTTRMLQEAIDEARTGRAVYVIAATEASAKWIRHKLLGMLAEQGVETELGIKVETPWSLGNFHFARLTPAPGAHPNCRWLVDHYTIEGLYGPMLEEWCRYDAPGDKR